MYNPFAASEDKYEHRMYEKTKRKLGKPEWQFSKSGFQVNLYFEERDSMFGKIKQLILEYSKMSYRKTYLNLTEAYLRGRSYSAGDVLRKPESKDIHKSVINEVEIIFSPPLIQDETTSISLRQHFQDILHNLEFDFDQGLIKENN